MNVHESSDYVGRLIVELSGSDQVPDHDMSEERSIIEPASIVEVVMPTRQVASTFGGLEEVTSPCKKQDGSSNGKKKN